jgi:glycosyltransferase involved in cell wall biosynthesis
VSAGLLHVVVPQGVDDPHRASGGNTYDRCLCSALAQQGWDVATTGVEGGWPWTARLGSWGLERALRRLPEGSLVLVDGLLASRLPEVVVPASARLRVVLLMHLPVGLGEAEARPAERRVVASATSVLTPSAWCRDWLLAEYDLDPARVHVARPGVEPAPVVPGTADGTSLLTVGSVSAVKGHDHLVAALARLGDLPWTWTAVGSTSVEPAFAAAVRATAAGLAIEDRCRFAGPLCGSTLESAYAAADVLVMPSRTETYGMVVAEALVRGVPVVAHDVGGVREALGEDGPLPGMLVRPGDHAALAAALRLWLGDRDVRERLRRAALERRTQLTGWSVTAGLVADVVRRAAA